ncbi:MAG: hypothetical protein GY751_11890 [Bacteroidetes bacterium]|nr:hypothetical protein [Bacteroidota bacterium]
MKKYFNPDIFLNQQFQLTGPDAQPIDIPVGGAIGLLALGDVGTIVWRQKQLEVKRELARRTQLHMSAEQNADLLSSKTTSNEEE